MLARSGAYSVRSRVIDDDAQVWLDFEWSEFCLPETVTNCRFQIGQGMVIFQAMVRSPARTMLLCIA